MHANDDGTAARGIKFAAPRVALSLKKMNGGRLYFFFIGAAP
jgi:hypothetical protein